MSLSLPSRRPAAAGLRHPAAVHGTREQLLRYQLEQPRLRALMQRIGPLPPRPYVFAQLALLARNAVRDPALAAAAFTCWPTPLRHAAVDLSLLEKEARRTAAIAADLAAGTAHHDHAVLAALLHDVGYWLLVRECPRELEQALELAVAAQIPLEAAERDILGTSHAEVGAWLLNAWNLPQPLVEAVAHHHHPERVTVAGLEPLPLLALAIAITGGDDCDGCARPPPPAAVVDEHYLAALHTGLTWSSLIERARHR